MAIWLSDDRVMVLVTLLTDVTVSFQGDALITECEFNTRKRENITLGGFAISEEMCVNYIHYYPKTSLEVSSDKWSIQTYDSQYTSNT